jgi:hypothetical protein
LALNLGNEVTLGDTPLDPDTIGSLQREFGKAAGSVPHIHTFYFPPFKPFACQGIFLESREKSDNARGLFVVHKN